jgi:hypothetical protein
MLLLLAGAFAAEELAAGAGKVGMMYLRETPVWGPAIALRVLDGKNHLRLPKIRAMNVQGLRGLDQPFRRMPVTFYVSIFLYKTQGDDRISSFSEAVWWVIPPSVYK